MIKHPHVPSKLYKFRNFSSNHLDALRRNMLWMSSPNRFNDPYEAAVKFNPDRFIVDDLTAHEFIAETNNFQKTVNSGGF
jgi:hypothetical protein